MNAAAIRVLFFILLAVGGVSSGAAAAGAQVVDPIGTVTSAISTITSQTTIVSDLAGGSTDAGSGLTDAVSGSTDAVFESSLLSGFGTTDATSSGSDGGSESASRDDASSGSATASNRGSPRTKFDRLPRRYETLLERIESGRHVRASIARLRALLAQASPEFRARVMRLIRIEIRRLERGGLTGPEREAAQRLGRFLAALQAQASQRSTSPALVEGSGVPTAIGSASGVQSATAGSESRAGGPPTNKGDGARIAGAGLPLPSLPSPSGLPYWLLPLAAIAGALLLLAGVSRHVLPLSGRGVIEVPLEIWMVAAAVILGLLAALVTVLLMDALLL